MLLVGQACTEHRGACRAHTQSTLPETPTIGAHLDTLRCHCSASQTPMKVSPQERLRLAHHHDRHQSLDCAESKRALVSYLKCFAVRFLIACLASDVAVPARVLGWPRAFNPPVHRPWHQQHPSGVDNHYLIFTCDKSGILFPERVDRFEPANAPWFTHWLICFCLNRTALTLQEISMLYRYKYREVVTGLEYFVSHPPYSPFLSRKTWQGKKEDRR